MSFVNEVVPESEVQSCGLDDLKREFDEWAWRNGRPAGYWHAWTIDRERGIYFYPVKIIEETGASGRPEPTSKILCILDYQGKRIKLLLDRTHLPSSFSESPFRVSWKLLEMDMSRAPEIPQDLILSVLKEVLAIYGYRGAYKQVPNTVVNVDF